MAEKKTGKNPFDGIVRYFKEVRSELKKVAWPTLRQIKNNTVIVIISIIFVGILIWVLDWGCKSLLGVTVDKYKAQTTQSTGSTQMPINAGNPNVNVGGQQQQQAQQQQAQQQAQQQQAAQNQNQSKPGAEKSENNGK